MLKREKCAAKPIFQGNLGRGEVKMKLKTSNSILKVIIFILLVIMLLDKIKDAFSVLIKLTLG